MKAALYKSSGIPVQGSFQHTSHENISIDSVASISQPVSSDTVVLSMLVAAHVEISTSGDFATVASMVLPPGVWILSIIPNSTISFLKLTGSDSGQASVIKAGE